MGTEAQHTSTPPHRDRQLAPCILLPDLSGSGTPPVPRGVALGSEWGSCFDVGWCLTAVLCCSAEQAGPVCHTPLATHIPLGILTLNFFFLFPPELRQEEEKDVFSLFFLLSLLYFSGLSAWKDTQMLNLYENIDTKTSILKCILVHLTRNGSFSSLLAEYCVACALSTALSFPHRLPVFRKLVCRSVCRYLNIFVCFKTSVPAGIKKKV